VVVHEAADGSGPPAGTPIAAYPEWHGWAERIAVPTNWVAALPDGVSFAQAATLPVAGLTALRALRAGGAILGRDVLITGATGGVGQFAVQLAAASGARVTAQVSRPDRRNDARQLGAHQAVVSLDEHSAGPFHLVLDAVGGPQLTQVIHHLAPGATVVLYGNRGGGTDDFRLRDFYQAGAYNARVIAFISTVPEDTKGEDLAILARLVADGTLRPHIGWTGDWTRTADALGALARRAFLGKAVLTIPRAA
jgi:NADPH:quinone reductase-like Zn-dependent oxidoreductase